MQQCNQVEKSHEHSKRKAGDFAALYDRNSENVQNEATTRKPEEDRGIFAGNPFSLFSGVFPGTLWCGSGDIATSYHNIGEVRARTIICFDVFI